MIARDSGEEGTSSGRNAPRAREETLANASAKKERVKNGIEETDLTVSHRYCGGETEEVKYAYFCLLFQLDNLEQASNHNGMITTSNVLEEKAISGLNLAFRFLEGYPSMTSEETNATYFYSYPVNFELFNGVMKNHYVSLDDAKRQTQRFLNHFRASGVKALWWLYPGSQLEGLEELLVSLGLKPYLPAKLMMKTLGSETEIDTIASIPGFEIRKAETIQELEAFMPVFSKAFGMNESLNALYFDGWKWLSFDRGSKTFDYFVGYLNGQPAGCAQVAYGTDTAGLWCIGTLPEFRRRGICRALSLECLKYGKRAGKKYAMLSASSMGHPQYLKLGFEDTVQIKRFLVTGQPFLNIF